MYTIDLFVLFSTEHTSLLCWDKETNESNKTPVDFWVTALQRLFAIYSYIISVQWLYRNVIPTGDRMRKNKRENSLIGLIPSFRYTFTETALAAVCDVHTNI